MLSWFQVITLCERLAGQDANVTTVPVSVLRFTRQLTRLFEWTNDVADRLAFSEVWSFLLCAWWFTVPLLLWTLDHTHRARHFAEILPLWLLIINLLCKCPFFLKCIHNSFDDSCRFYPVMLFSLSQWRRHTIFLEWMPRKLAHWKNTCRIISQTFWRSWKTSKHSLSKLTYSFNRRTSMSCNR